MIRIRCVDHRIRCSDGAFQNRDIIQRTTDGASVSEIATALDLPAARVSDQKYKAIRKLREHVSLA